MIKSFGPWNMYLGEKTNINESLSLFKRENDGTTNSQTFKKNNLLIIDEGVKS